MCVKYFLFVLFIWNCNALTRRERSKQSRGNFSALWNLEKMTECHLHCSALMKYNDYGCWCGPGGGGTPVDEIDKCCKKHDQCYDAIVDSKICFSVAEEYVFDYTWSCLTNGTAACSENQSKCQQYLCWCDKMVVDCWGNFNQPQSKKSCLKSKYTNNLTLRSPKKLFLQAKNSKPPLAGPLDFLISAWMFIPTRIFS